MFGLQYITFMQGTREYLKDFDDFAAPATLRIRGDPQTKSLCTGIASFVLNAFMIYFIIIKSMKMFEFDDIQFAKTQQDQIQAAQTLHTDTIMFGVKFKKTNNQHYSVDEALKTFNVIMNHSAAGVITSHRLEQCKNQTWQKFILGDQPSQESIEEFKLNYANENLQNYLCPQQGVFLKGLADKQFGDISNSTYSILYIEPCFYNDTELNKNCYTFQRIATDLTNIVNQDYFVTMEFIYTDVKLNPKNPQASQNYINFDSQITFTLSRGTFAQFRYGHFVIYQDRNFYWPSQDTSETVEGFFISKTNYESFERSNLGKPFILTTVGLSPSYIQIQRVFGKYDHVLSDVGGLMEILVAFMGFFALGYNQYRYELQMAEGAFNLDEDGKRIRTKNFHFVYYAISVLYEWISVLLCCDIKKTQYFQNLQKTREEANKQLDVTYLYKRIEHLEQSIRYILDEKQQMCLHLIQPNSIAKSENRRRITYYYDKIIHGEPAKTFQDAFEQYKNEQNYAFSKAYQLPYSYDIPDQISVKRVMEKAYETFPKQKRAARQEVLEQQYEQIENLFMEAFYQLDEFKKREFLLKMPIKIVERLQRARSQISNETPNISSMQLIY